MESPSEDSWREFFTKTPEFKARMSTCNSFRNNLVSLFTGEFDDNIRRWLPLAFLNYKTEFKNEALKLVVQSEYSDAAVNAFALSRNGDCCAYLLRFCLLLIDCKIVTEEDLVLVEGQSLISDNKGNIQRIVQVVENQIFRAGNAKPAKKERHFALEIKIAESKILFLDPAMGLWLIRCNTEKKVLARFFFSEDNKDVEYSDREGGIYWSEKKTYDFQVENNFNTEVLKHLRTFIVDSIKMHMSDNNITPEQLITPIE